jgi:hypothetical protein
MIFNAQLILMIFLSLFIATPSTGHRIEKVARQERGQACSALALLSREEFDSPAEQIDRAQLRLLSVKSQPATCRNFQFILHCNLPRTDVELKISSMFRSKRLNLPTTFTMLLSHTGICVVAEFLPPRPRHSFLFPLLLAGSSPPYSRLLRHLENGSATISGDRKQPLSWKEEFSLRQQQGRHLP